MSTWFELEHGDGNDYGSWAIERNEETDIPYLVHHHYRHGQGKDYTTQHKIADREMMEKYPHVTYYVQTDPRGCSLYILSVDGFELYILVTGECARAFQILSKP